MSSCFFGLATSFALAVLLPGGAEIFKFVIAFAVYVLSSLVVSGTLKWSDRKTIANFRRVQAVLLAGAILWLVCIAIGFGVAWVAESSRPLFNAVFFGAVTAAGFEFIIINGTFERNVLLSGGLAFLYPLATLFAVTPVDTLFRFDSVAPLAGGAAAIIIGLFTFILNRRKTSLGHSALSFFRAFMKTWVAGKPEELERIISDHSETTEVTTKVMRFAAGKENIFIVLPGVHPGPFHPVGSYDLPGVISREFVGLGRVMTLHRPGGHERNLATSADTLKYAEDLRGFAEEIKATPDIAEMRGPIQVNIGKATATAASFANDLILTISFAPFGADDLSTEVEEQLRSIASSSGYDLSVVDAHNAISGDLESPDMSDLGWRRVIEQVEQIPPASFRVAYSHSSEFGFKGGEDLTENGIGLLMTERGGSKSVLVLADANNAVPPLRTEVSKTLDTLGYTLTEFCTSDSHNLAARGLTVARGYEALGEGTPTDSISSLILRMARAADSRLARGSYGSGTLKSRVRVFGSGSLEEFARITQSSSRFARKYLSIAGAMTTVLFLIALAF